MHKFSITVTTPCPPQKGRDPVIDIARGSAMLLVILGHSLLIFFFNRPDGQFDYQAFFTAQAIQSFHIPAFYFISGMTALKLQDRSPPQIASQALTLILFAYATHLLAVPLVGMAQGDLSHPLSLLKLAIKPFIFGTDFALVVPWFLISIAAVQCLAWIYLRVSAWGKILLCAALLSIFIVDNLGLKSLFMNNTWGIGLFFFLIGRQFMRLKSLNLKPIYALMTAFVMFTLVAYLHPFNKGCMFNPTNICNNSVFPSFGVNILTSQIGFIPAFLVSAFTGITALVFFSQSIASTAGARFFVWIGQNTLSLLILNGFVLVVVTPFLARYISAEPWSWLIWSSFITAAHLVILPLIKPGMDALQSGCRQISEALIQSIKTRLPNRMQ